MKKIITLVFIQFCITISLLLQSANTIQAQWVQTNGPYGGTVLCFAANGSTLYAGTYGGGVFRSTNQGTSWSSVNIGLPDAYITSLVVSGNTIFAPAANRGIFRSTDNGGTWISSNAGLIDSFVRSVATMGTKVFASNSKGVALSTDNGMSWTQTSLSSLNVFTLFAEGSNLFAGCVGGQIFLTTDAGISWKNVTSGVQTTEIRAFASIGTTVFVGTQETGIYRSTNNGADWTSIAINPGTSSDTVLCFTTSGTNLYAGTRGGVFLSTNNGTSWTSVNTGLPSLNIPALYSSGSNLFAASYSHGVYRSTNTVHDWTSTDTGLTNKLINSFALNGSTIFAGTDAGVFSSTNEGAAWTEVNQGLTDTYVESVAATGPKLFAGTVHGRVFYSTNNGLQWNATTHFTGSIVKSLVISGTSLFAGTSREVSGDGVFLSTNDGSSWSAVNTGLTDTNVNVLFVNGSRLYAGTFGGGIFLSVNNGTNWTAINSGLTSKGVYSFAASGSNLFAGTDDGVFLSTDNGTSWTKPSSDLNNEVIGSLAIAGTNIFAGIISNHYEPGKGIFISQDNGKNWKAVNQGLEAFNQFYFINALAVTASNLLAGTGYNSIWKRPLSEMTSGNSVSSETHPSISLEQNTPNPFSALTTIRYVILSHDRVRITLSNMLGEKIKTLMDEDADAGTHDLTINANELASGMYVVTMTAEGIIKSQKICVQK